jgi:hypothetical protein
MPRDVWRPIRTPSGKHKVEFGFKEADKTAAQCKRYGGIFGTPDEAFAKYDQMRAELEACAAVLDTSRRSHRAAVGPRVERRVVDMIKL